MGDCYATRLEVEAPDPGIIPRLIEDLTGALDEECESRADGPSWRVFSCDNIIVKITSSIPEPGLLMLPPSKVVIVVEGSNPNLVVEILRVASRILHSKYRGLVSSQLLV